MISVLLLNIGFAEMELCTIASEVVEVDRSLIRFLERLRDVAETRDGSAALFVSELLEVYQDLRVITEDRLDQSLWVLLDQRYQERQDPDIPIDVGFSSAVGVARQILDGRKLHHWESLGGLMGLRWRCQIKPSWDAPFKELRNYLESTSEMVRGVHDGCRGKNWLAVREWASELLSIGVPPELSGDLFRKVHSEVLAFSSELLSSFKWDEDRVLGIVSHREPVVENFAVLSSTTIEARDAEIARCISSLFCQLRASGVPLERLGVGAAERFWKSAIAEERMSQIFMHTIGWEEVNAVDGTSLADLQTVLERVLAQCPSSLSDVFAVLFHLVANHGDSEVLRVDCASGESDVDFSASRGAMASIPAEMVYVIFPVWCGADSMIRKIPLRDNEVRFSTCFGDGPSLSTRGVVKNWRVHHQGLEAVEVVRQMSFLTPGKEIEPKDFQHVVTTPLCVQVGARVRVTYGQVLPNEPGEKEVRISDLHGSSCSFAGPGRQRAHCKEDGSVPGFDETLRAIVSDRRLMRGFQTVPLGSTGAETGSIMENLYGETVRLVLTQVEIGWVEAARISAAFHMCARHGFYHVWGARSSSVPLTMQALREAGSKLGFETPWILARAFAGSALAVGDEAFAVALRQATEAAMLNVTGDSVR